MGMLPTEELCKWCAKQEIILTPAMLEQFSIYATFMIEYNAHVNLTAIVEPREIAIKHFYDSLLLLAALRPKAGARLIDVGTGAGFPGVPVKIARPDMPLMLLDGTQKRVLFLQKLLEKLSLKGQLLHARAEEAGKTAAQREQYDIATARAVATLPQLCEYCLPFVKVGGVFAAMKARGVQEEMERAAEAVRLLGGEMGEVKTYLLPDGGKRSIICVKKISQTPTMYPRTSAKMAKNPL